MSWEYFLRLETQTGVIIGYDEDTGEFEAAPSCHPGKGFKDDSLNCIYCGWPYDGKVTIEALKSWSTKWNIAWNGSSRSDEEVIAEWVEGWTGVAADKLDIEVKQR